MPTAKEAITEERASALLVFSVMRAVTGRWMQINTSFRKLIRDETFSFADDDDALFDLILAVIASEAGALASLFPADQGSRLLDICIANFSPEHLEYVRHEIEEYRKCFQKALDEGENPIYAIPVRLLHRWLGSVIRDHLVRFESNVALALGAQEAAPYIDPLLVQVFSEGMFFELIGFGRWKGIHDQYEIVPRRT